MSSREKRKAVSFHRQVSAVAVIVSEVLVKCRQMEQVQRSLPKGKINNSLPQPRQSLGDEGRAASIDVMRPQKIPK